MTDPLRRALHFALPVALVLGLAACSGPDPDGPEAAFENVTRGLADGRPQVVWQALPASYQQDVTEVVHGAAETVDPELWNRTFTVLQKLSTLLSDKRDLILDNPMFAQGMEDRGDAEKAWKAAAKMFETVVESDLADLEKVKSLDVESFLSGTAADLMKQLSRASALAPDDPWNRQMKDLRSAKASVLDRSDDTAKLRIKHPGRPPVEEDWVRVEGKWIPQNLSDAWPLAVAGVKEQLAAVSDEENPAEKQKALATLTMVEGVLDNLLAADNAAQFNAAVGTAMGMAMSAMMAQNEGGGLSLPLGSSSGTSFGSFSAPPPEPIAELEPARPKVRINKDGTIPLAKAKHFVGETLWVTSSNGIDCRCKLAAIENGVLMFEKHLASGSISFDLSPREIRSLRVIGG